MASRHRPPDRRRSTPSGGQVSSADTTDNRTGEGAMYSREAQWQRRYRDELEFDEVRWGSHCVDCYPGNCSYNVFVRDGRIVREEIRGSAVRGPRLRRARRPPARLQQGCRVEQAARCRRPRALAAPPGRRAGLRELGANQLGRRARRDRRRPDRRAGGVRVGDDPARRHTGGRRRDRRRPLRAR